MIPDKKEPIIDSYTHMKSDVVPEWVNKLDELKEKIKANIYSPDGAKANDVTFCHPINVPDTKNR